jgi:hypothetical protein
MSEYPIFQFVLKAERLAHRVGYVQKRIHLIRQQPWSRHACAMHANST